MTGIMSIRRCGTCHFGKIVAQDISKRVCWGAPPTAIQVSSSRGGQTLQMIRPVVSVSDDACALYRGKEAEDVVRDDQTIRALQSASVSETKQ